MTQRPPEHIEREMFEIRTRLNPGVSDLKKHLQPAVIAGQAKKKLVERIKVALSRAKGRLWEQQRGLRDSAGFQYSLARKVSKDRDTAPFTDAVRNDPRPLVVLAIALTVLLALTWRILR